MAGPTLPKLPTLPWPTLVSASLLLHAGVLSVGLPKMLRVSQPDSNGVNIPVTLVDDAAEPAAISENLPPSATATTTEAPPPQSAAPIGGQNTAVDPGARTHTLPVTPPQPRESAETNTPEPAVPTRETVGSDRRETIPENEQPQDRQSGNTQAVAETGDSSQESSQGPGDGPTEVSITDDVYLPKESGGDRIDTYPTPTFQMPLALSIPRNHGCQGSLPTDTLTVGVAIDTDGLVSSLRRYQPDIYGQNSDIKLADCLLSAVLQSDPNGVRFAPATRLTNIGEEEAVVTDRVQLRLQFR